jgi:hypothetical protein
MKIEKGVPIPKVAHATAESVEIARQMEIDDSVFVDTLNAAERIRNALRYYGGNGCVRKVNDGYRVWRIS